MLHPHEILTNIIITLTTPVSTTGEPIPSNGILKKKLNYVFDMEKFEEERDAIFSKNFHPPDGFLRNSVNNISITVECKSGLDEDITNLRDQLRFYSENENFKNVFIQGEERNEILIVCTNKCFNSVLNVVTDVQIAKNLIIWRVKKTYEDKFIIRKVYGTHIDEELDELMEQGVSVSPPYNLLLLTPNISMTSLIGTLGMRITANFIQSELEIDKFISNQNDVIIPYQKIKKAIEHLFILVQEIGELEGEKIIFKKRPNFSLILKKIEFIYGLKKVELYDFLREKSLTEETIEEFQRKRAPQRRINYWTSNNN